MHNPRRWNIAADGCSDAAAELAARLKASPLLAQVLINRGISDPGDCSTFLSPNLKHLHHPSLLPNLPRAAERLARAVRDGERVIIYGDYDVDGITATAILWHAIRVLGGRPEFYIPHRVDEGYGLNAEALAQLCRDGAKLVVTVDCGVTAVAQAKIARECGVDLIITDHHEWKSGGGVEDLSGGVEPNASTPPPPYPTTPPPLLPDCHSVVHPRLPREDGSAYPNPALCGAGVALKLAWGLGLAMSGADRVSDAFRAFLIEATALAALGTIADVVPLVGENRILAHFGLTGLRNTRLVGLRALIASAGLLGQKLDSFDVGFRIAPRLNACGRMGHARLAVELLTTEDTTKAAQIADYLEQQNRARQVLEKRILDQAVAQVHEQGNLDGRCALVLGRDDWHPGVIGIVASRIVDRFHRPTVMVALNNGHGQGSARSIAGFHLARAFEACAETLETFGGHEMAAGLKLRTERLDDFRQAFCAYAGRVLTSEQLVPALSIDCVAELPQISEPLVRDLSRLGPFGSGNRKPLFCCRGLEVTAPPRRVGNGGDHLQLYVRQAGQIFKCIAFGYGPLDAQLATGTKIDLAVEPQINEYNGRTSVELEIRDVQFTSVS